MNLKELQAILAKCKIKPYRSIPIASGITYHNGIWQVTDFNSFLQVRYKIGDGTFFIPLPLAKKAKKIEIVGGHMLINGFEHPEAYAIESDQLPSTGAWFQLKNYIGVYHIDIPNITDTVCSTNPLVPAMNGICFDFPESKAIATDAHILRTWELSNIKLIKGDAVTSQVIYPTTIVQLKGMKGLNVQVNKGASLFLTKDFDLVVKHIDEKFPAYQNVFPSPNDVNYIVSAHKDIMLALCDSIPESGKHKHFAMEIKDEKVTVFGKDAEGQISDKGVPFLHCQVIQPSPEASIRVGLDAKKLKTIVASITESAFISMGISTNNRAFFINDSNLIFPMIFS
jgi:hypothetical protein